MNYLRHYLRKNKHISQLNKIFNNNNMVIDHLAHRTFKIDKVCNKYTKNTIDSAFKMIDTIFQIIMHMLNGGIMSEINMKIHIVML